MSGAIAVERRDELAIVTLDNPKKRNALDPPMLDALCDALARLPDEGARAVVLTAAGDRAFSSGFDLSALSDEAALANNPLARALAAISGGALPVIAALNGLAIGGGCELAASCDLRVAHPQVTLMMPPVRLGIVYPPSGLQRFVALIGASRVRELFLCAQPISAERALGWGLVDRVVPEAEVLPCAIGLAREIARGAPLAVRGTRKILEELIPPLAPEVARQLAELQRAAWISDDAREARQAFAEKRAPRFAGR
jgi:enoyl-CoA hydratase/carnithine racemase